MMVISNIPLQLSYKSGFGPDENHIDAYELGGVLMISVRRIMKEVVISDYCSVIFIGLFQCRG